LRLYGITTSRGPVRKIKPIPGAETAAPALARAGFATLLAMTGVGSAVLRKTKPIVGGRWHWGGECLQREWAAAPNKANFASRDCRVAALLAVTGTGGRCAKQSQLAGNQIDANCCA